jgi:hypothetical protein
MDQLVAFVLGFLSAVVLALINDVLAKKRASSDRRNVGEIERIDRCNEVFSARFKYITAYHSAAPDLDRIRQDYLDLQHRYRWADPEVILLDTDDWAAWIKVEQEAYAGRKTVPSATRVGAVRAAGIAFLDSLVARRK